jgi:predicted CopG family antitoxin
MNIMAKNIMISNEVYEKLSKLKENSPNMSYSDVIINSLEIREGKKTMMGLRECFGILKEDKEYDEVRKKLKKGWVKWTKKYV